MAPERESLPKELDLQGGLRLVEGRVPIAVWFPREILCFWVETFAMTGLKDVKN